MNEEILKELDALKKTIRLAIEGSSIQSVLEYLHGILNSDIIFYNYVQNSRIVMGKEENITMPDCFEYEI